MASPLHIADVHGPASQAAALGNAVAAWQRCLLRCAAQRSKILRASRPTFRKLFASFISKQHERCEQHERCPDSFDGIHEQDGSAVIHCASAVALRPRLKPGLARRRPQEEMRDRRVEGGGGGRLSADALGGPAGAEDTRGERACSRAGSADFPGGRAGAGLEVRNEVGVPAAAPPPGPRSATRRMSEGTLASRHKYFDHRDN